MNFNYEHLFMESGDFFDADEEMNSNQFFLELYTYNHLIANEIRTKHEKDSRNRLKAKLFAFYEDNNYKNYEQYEFQFYFISSWDNDCNNEENVTLGDSYKNFNLYTQVTYDMSNCQDYVYQEIGYNRDN